MGRHLAYPDYVPSETDWLGEVPRGWGSVAIGRRFQRVKRTDFPDEELLSVYRDHGVIPKSSRDDNFNKPSEDLSPYQLVCPGDLVMNKMKAWQGSIAMSEHRGIVSPAYFVYRRWEPSDTQINKRYVHYLLRSPAYVAQYLRRSKGIRVNQWDLDPMAFERIEMLLPSSEEQTQIAKFLDYETAKIDALVAKQQQLIALLKEKRQAVISHAVTRGLNPDAPMRDSGIEWLGRIPGHWTTCRLKHVTSFMTSGPRGWSDLISKDGTDTFLQSGDLNDKLGLNLDTAQRITPPQNAEGVRTRVEEGDVVVCITGAKTGRVAFVENLSQTIYVNQHLSLIRPVHELVLPRFLATMIASSAVKAYFSVEQYGLKEGLSLSKIAEIPLCLPPISEQHNIVSHLTSSEMKMDRLESMAEAQVACLRERRMALISAAVTGKIDVRNWTPPPPEAA